MIHHFARALAVREQTRAQATVAQRPPSGGAAPIATNTSAVTPFSGRLRIRRDPADARRTVIAGRFADVCAALDRMAAELEAA